MGPGTLLYLLIGDSGCYVYYVGISNVTIII